MEDSNKFKVTLRVNVDGRVEITKALVDSAGVTGFNASQLLFASIVVDDAAATTGTVSITASGLAYAPVISATTANALTDLGGAAIGPMTPEGYSTVTNFTQSGPGAASFTYNLAAATGNNRWAGSLISFASAFSLASKNLVIAASDGSSSYITRSFWKTRTSSK